jgi:DNA invertase Pin-like site-specific DNA recombinase
VSTDKQDEALQLDALEKAGCERTFVDHMSGSTTSRPQLDAMLDMLRPGDKVVIWKLDRLGRSLIHLVELVNQFKERGIGLAVLTGEFVTDTSTASGEFVFHMFAALAQFERRLIRERTMAGLAAARARGRVGGRPRAIKPAQLDRALELVMNGASLREAARQVKANRTTMHRYLKEALSRELAAYTACNPG